MSMSVNIKDRYRRFKAWQKLPFHYEMPEGQTHRCQNCGLEHTGNYCPCCGQKATLGEVNWNSVRENVMEIWGVGTRSMTFTLWQLLWRPGYFIRDYISGRRQVSFPPVKMLLIMAIICTLILNLIGPEASTISAEPAEKTDTLSAFFDWCEKNQGWGFLILCSTMILPTWILFHHAPRCTAHSLPQGFFIQVFLSILTLVFTTLSELSHPLVLLVPFYYVISYWQLFGYGFWPTLWRTLTCFVLALLVVVMFILLVANVKRNDTLGVPTWAFRLVCVAIISTVCAVILGIGYAIGRWTWKRRIRINNNNK